MNFTTTQPKFAALTISLKFLRASSFLLVCFSSAVNAVSNTPVLNKNPVQLEHVIVTAERRETILQQTPISIAAFTAEDIEGSGITNPQELAFLVPGLAIGNTSNTGFPEVYLRGVGTRDPSVASDLSIGFYIDDVYVGRSSSIFVDLFDLDRIEVLKGPQATLWGRNTIGGAIHIVTAEPTNEFMNKHKFTYGNFDLLRLTGTVSGPLSEDKLFAKFSYSYQDRNGYVNNVSGLGDLGEAEGISAKASIIYRPSTDIKFKLNMDIAKDRPNSAGFDPVVTGPVLGGLVGNTTILDAPLSHVEPNGPFNVNQSTNSREYRDVYGISGKLTWETERLLFTSITAGRITDFDLQINNSGVSSELIDFLQDTQHWQFSQELRLEGKLGNELDWLIGGYFYHEEFDDELLLSLRGIDALLAPVFGTQDYSALNFSDGIANSYALFGEFSYAVNEYWSVTLGARYTYEEKDFDARRVNNEVLPLLLGSTFPLTALDNDWRAFTPKIGIEYRPSSNILYYGSVSRGFKSGGYNSFQFDLENAFDPEYLIAYEVGIKSSWLEERLRLNIAAFYYDHKDLQVQTIITNGAAAQLVTTNAAETRDYGLELQLSALPMEGLHISGSLTYLDAEYENFINASGLDVGGNTVNFSPELTTNLGVKYTFRLHNYGSLSLMGEHQYRSRIYFTETNESILSQKAHHNVNARLEFTPQSDKFSIAAFVKNLTDVESVHTGVDFRGVLGVVSNMYNPPRTYGVEFNISF